MSGKSFTFLPTSLIPPTPENLVTYCNTFSEDLLRAFVRLFSLRFIRVKIRKIFLYENNCISNFFKYQQKKYFLFDKLFDIYFLFLSGEEFKWDSKLFLYSYHQRLREYRFYVNIGRGVNIGCERCFYIALSNMLH